MNVIKIVAINPAEEVRKIAGIHRVSTRMVYYALRGQLASEKALKIRATALRRGKAVQTDYTYQ